MPFSYLFNFIIYLLSIQLIFQIFLSILKNYYAWKAKKTKKEGERTSLGIPFYKYGQKLLGLTGENHPKKKIIYHDEMESFFLYFISLCIICFKYAESELDITSVVKCLFISMVGTVLMRFSNFFILLKIYSDSGFGINFYWKGYRILGLDYHNWLIRQDPKTGKPLRPEEQYTCWARPHIDLPYWNIHHWPWENFDSEEELNEKKNVTKKEKEEKFKRKEEKKKRKAQRAKNKNPENSSNGNGNVGDAIGESGLIGDLGEIGIGTINKENIKGEGVDGEEEGGLFGILQDS